MLMPRHAVARSGDRDIDGARVDTHEHSDPGKGQRGRRIVPAVARMLSTAFCVTPKAPR